MTLVIKTAAIVIDSPVGHLSLTATEDCLTQCGWSQAGVNTDNMSPFLATVVKQLTEYFAGQRYTFTIPLAPVGTVFQRAVWQALSAIPYGETRSYQQLAMAIGRAKAYRAAGSANGKNPLCIIIPCHRVIRATGELGGFTGDLAHKRWLLTLEKNTRDSRG